MEYDRKETICTMKTKISAMNHDLQSVEIF